MCGRQSWISWLALRGWPCRTGGATGAANRSPATAAAMSRSGNARHEGSTARAGPAWLYDRVVTKDDDLGAFRRLLLAWFGLMLTGNLQGGVGLSWMIGLFGVIVFLGAVGVIELAMALWYRSQRRHSGG